MFIANCKDFFTTDMVEFPKFIGEKISRNCPQLGSAVNGNFIFRSGTLLNEAIIKSPFYVRIYVYFRNLFEKITKK